MRRPLPGPEAEAEVEGVLAGLRRRLESEHYVAVHRLHCHELAPRFLRSSLAQTLALAPPRTRLLLRLFYFEEPLAQAEAEEALGPELLAGLLACGVLEGAVAAGPVRARYRVEFAGDTFLFTENLAGRPQAVYFGEDSQFLRSQLRPRAGDRCLDLCTGTGVQGLRCAQVAAAVDLVDVHPRAVQLARLNAAFNGLSHRVSVHEGDLWQALPPAASYDYVVCNPPLMPVADDLSFPLFGHGGPDGLRIVRRVLEALERRLRRGGRCTLIGASTGDERGAEVAGLAASTLARGFATVLFLLLRTPLRDWIRMIAETSALFDAETSVAQAVLRSRAAYGRAVEEIVVYTYLLEIERAPVVASHRIVDYSRVGHRSFWFVNRGRFTA